MADLIANINSNEFFGFYEIKKYGQIVSVQPTNNATKIVDP